MRIYDDEARDLAGAILKQAVEDYRELIAKGREKIKTASAGNFSRLEIEEFFDSDFCDSMILRLGVRRMTGPEFLRKAI